MSDCTDRGASWDAGAISSYGGRRQLLRGISIQLQDIQSTVQKCLQEVSRAERVHEESGRVRSAIERGVQVTGEMVERGTAILQDAHSSLGTFLSLLQPQKSVLSTNGRQNRNHLDCNTVKQEPLSKPAPAQEDLPLDPDDLSSSDEETGAFNPGISASVGVPPPPPCLFPGNTQELSGLILREESTGGYLEHTSTPVVLNTKKATSPPYFGTGKVDPHGCDNLGPSCSHEFQDPDSQFDKLMEEFVSPDDFCHSFSQFDNEDTLLGSSECEGEKVTMDSESDNPEEVEEVDHVKTVSEVATEANISNLFDPRVLGCPPPDQEHTDKLKQYFGHSMFKPEQWRIIHSILYQGRDNCAVMATGFGKSLCYQYPAVFRGKVVIVVSPLISLMEDQVMALNVKGIPAVFLGSAQSSKSAAMSGILSGTFRLVYLTPEYITHAIDLIQDIDKKVGITLIAIDEAHCVSHWGHDFRGDYRTLGQIRSWLPCIPLLALTATATPPVRKDISSSLHLNNPLETCTSFDRPNLYLEVRMKSDSVLGDLKPIMQASRDKKNRSVYNFEGPTIVYCRTKQMTESVETVLRNAGVNCDKYHAGLSNEQRKKTHHKFLRDELQCIVATVAFGMGIDKPDIRVIVHYGAPQDIESYYQELGRAGRDGSPSKCYVFYKPADFNTNRFFLRDLTDQVYKTHKTEMLVKMEKYLATRQCRRKTLLLHFANKVSEDVGGHKMCCDNCKRKLTAPPSSANDPQQDYSKEGRLLLELIKEGGHHNGLGLGTYVMILRGSKSQRVPFWAKRHDHFGAGMNHSEKWWKAFGYQLKMDGYVQERAIVGSYGSATELSAKGKKWLSKAALSNSYPLNVTPTQEMLALERPPPSTQQPRSYLPQAGSAPLSLDFLSDRGATPTATPLYLPTAENPTSYYTVVVERKATVQLPSPPQKDPRIIELENALYQDLLMYRNLIAHESGMAPFLVGTNKLLADLARVRPSSVERLKQVEGVSNAWVENFGERMLRRIGAFCQKSGHVPLDVSDAAGKVVEPRERTVKVPLVKRACLVSSLTNTVNISYDKFANQNLTVVEIAKQRNISVDTVMNHLTDALEAGFFVDYRRAGLSEENEELITNVIRKEPICSDISRMKAIKNVLPESVRYSDIKMTIAILMVKTGFVRPTKSSTENLISPPAHSSTNTGSSIVSSNAGLQSRDGWHSGNKRKLPSSFNESSSLRGDSKFRNKNQRFW